MLESKSDISKEVKSGWRDTGVAEAVSEEVYHVISGSGAHDSRAEVKTGTNSDDDKTDVLLYIMNEFKVLRKEMQDTRKTVKCEIEQMKQYFNNSMNGVFETFEKQWKAINKYQRDSGHAQ